MQISSATLGASTTHAVILDGAVASTSYSDTGIEPYTDFAAAEAPAAVLERFKRENAAAIPFGGFFGDDLTFEGAFDGAFAFAGF